jgi:hypothetical protein
MPRFEETAAEYKQDVATISRELKVPRKALAELVLSRPKAQQSASQIRKQKNIANRILAIADQVAIDVRLKFRPIYSNWHTWELLHKANTKEQLYGNSNLDLMIDSSPYGNCLFMAYDCFMNFREALNIAGLQAYADRVEFATDNFNQNPKSARHYHCIAMLRLWDQCIVLDPVAHGYAIKVRLGHIWATPSSTFRLAYFAQNDARLLVEYGMDDGEAYNVLQHPESREFNYNDPFLPIKNGITGAIENLAWPSDSYLGRLPSRRCVWLQQVWDGKPSEGVGCLAMKDDSGRYVVETGRLFIDLIEREVTLEDIPYGDWLARPENKYFMRRLRNRNGFSLQTGTCAYRAGEAPATVEYTLDLGTPVDGFSKRVSESLQFFNELCEALGMSKGEFLRMTDVMLEAWKEVDKDQKKAPKRKRGGDAGYRP